VKPFARKEHVDGPRSTCRHCGQHIVRVPEVGWVDPVAGDSYDVCPGDPFGNHDPAPAAPARPRRLRSPWAARG
jgi:hypothetical protein